MTTLLTPSEPGRGGAVPFRVPRPPLWLLDRRFLCRMLRRSSSDPVTAALVERLGDMTYTKDDLTGLGAKLDALDLTDGESAALHAIFDAATPAEEVEGFAVFAKYDGIDGESLSSPLGTNSFGVRVNAFSFVDDWAQDS